MFKLGVMVADKASGLKGCLTHMQIWGSKDNHSRFYNFQPAKLSEEDGSPAPRSWITEDRIEGETTADPSLPVEVLGTKAEDIITGFKGTVTAIIFHINGCLHLELQPQGSHPKSGKMLSPCDFDIRMLKGEAIPNLTEPELQKSRQERPSPASHDRVLLRAM